MRYSAAFRWCAFSQPAKWNSSFSQFRVTLLFYGMRSEQMLKRITFDESWWLCFLLMKRISKSCMLKLFYLANLGYNLFLTKCALRVLFPVFFRWYAFPQPACCGIYLSHKVGLQSIFTKCDFRTHYSVVLHWNGFPRPPYLGFSISRSWPAIFFYEMRFAKGK